MEQRHEKIWGRERDGVHGDGVHGVHMVDITGIFRKESREFEGGGLG